MTALLLQQDTAIPSRTATWARGILIAGICLSLLCSLPVPLRAQTEDRPAAVLAAKSDPLSLPDAPTPAASATSPDEPIVISRSLQPPAQSPPPSAGPSLGDLGLTQAETEGSAQRQALLDRRTHMLKVHQRLGLITVIPVAAACISAAGAPPEHGNYGNTTSRDVHVALGAAAVAMYGATAYYAIRAPKVSNEPARGGIKWHKYLIYIHAPGMVLTPILGAMAFNQINSGQKVHGIASAHGGVAAATAISYGAAIVAVSWPIHIKF